MPKLNRQPNQDAKRRVREFTIAEHLQVQRQIEQRAYNLWLMHGGDDRRAFNHWLKAEAEVLAEFVQARMDVAITRSAGKGGTHALPLTIVHHQPPGQDRNPSQTCNNRI